MGCVSATKVDFERGAEWIRDARQDERYSRDQILAASKLRQQIAQLHKEKRATENVEKQAELAEQIKVLGQQMVELRASGAELRATGLIALDNALVHYSAAMRQRWSQWISSPSPLQLAGTTTPFFGHNAKVASVDPAVRSRQNDLAAARVGAEGEDSELIAILKGQEAPADLKNPSFSLSRTKKWIGHIEVFPDERWGTKVPLNEIHRWILVVSDQQGNPVDADFDVVGHMPGHVHGLPTAPEVADQLAPGVYVVEGVKFQMRGWWVMQFETEDDSIRFNIVL